MNAGNRAETAVRIVRKGAEAGLRLAGASPELLQARILAARMKALDLPTGGPRVLIVSPRDWAVHVQWEAMIGHALRWRGADVEVLTCLGGLSTCDRVNVYEGPPPPCTTCGTYSRRAWNAHGFALHDIAVGTSQRGEFDDLSIEELGDVWVCGVPVGAIARRTARWFLCSSALGDDPLAPATIRDFTDVAAQLTRSTLKILDAVVPDSVLVLNGLFLFESVVSSIALQRDIRVVSYERGQVFGSLFVTDGPRAPEYDVSEGWDAAARKPLSEDENVRLDEYLASRRAGRISYLDLSTDSEEAAVGVGTDRDHVVVFTNVTWDTAAHGSGSAFESMGGWLGAVVDVARRHPTTQFIIRVHPAEVRIPTWRTREPVTKLLEEIPIELPSNVTVIPPDDATSSYGLMACAKVGLVYTSTTGLELALTGVPVVTAGGPHYAGKGFTTDVRDPASFIDTVTRVLDDPTSHRPDVELARRYANHFFFVAPVPQPPVTEPVPGLARLATVDPDDLSPGVHEGLDRICARILGM